MKDTLSAKSGPKGNSLVNPKDIRFQAVRVTGHLRRLATPPALMLAADIEAALADVARQGEEAANGPVREGPASLGDKTVQVTPALVRLLTEMHLLLSLQQMISERLRSDPSLAHLEKLTH